MAQSAGDRVSAFTAEISMATLIGDRELAEQLARDAGDEGDRHEDRQQHQADGDDRAGDLAHRLERRLVRRHLGMLLHHPLDVLDHHDASSTTMPIASTSASSDTVLAE
jgi:hypothetical protein